MYDQEHARRGYVYILVNPTFTGFVKIGKTTKDPQARAREIARQVGVQLYQVVWDALVNDCHDVERLIHQELAHYRGRNDREFFSLSPKQAIALVTRVVAPYVCTCEEGAMAELTLASEMPPTRSLDPQEAPLSLPRLDRPSVRRQQDAPTGTIGARAEHFGGDNLNRTSSYDERFARYWQCLLERFRNGTRLEYAPKEISPGKGNSRHVEGMDEGTMWLRETAPRGGQSKCLMTELRDDFWKLSQDPDVENKALPSLRQQHGIKNLIEFKRHMFEEFRRS